MKLNTIRTKASLLGASGVLTLGAGAGIAAVAHPALAAPAVTTPDTGDAVEVVEGPDAPEVQAPETPEAPAAAQGTTAPTEKGADAAGGHADPPGTNVDNQHQGEGESDG